MLAYDIRRVEGTSSRRSLSAAFSGCRTEERMDRNVLRKEKTMEEDDKIFASQNL
ncbi:MAG: hypothetical protein ACLRZ5_18885 [Ruminococcus sp.]